MRTLLFLSIGLFVLVAVMVSNWLAARKAAQDDRPVEPEPQDTLGARLSEAAETFGAASDAMGSDHNSLKAALADLASQCAALASRSEADSRFAQTARAAVTRLLLALYGVVERLNLLTRHGNPEPTAPLLESATGLIVSATDALHNIAERADETALRHLEADIDVLRERLDRAD